MEIEMDAFDVEAYAAQYSGRNRIERLLFIARQCPELQVDAYRVLLRELEQGRNMALYTEIAAAAADVSPSLGAIDQAHVDTVAKSTAQQHERLEQELNSYKSSMIKESIRMGHNDLGDFFYEIGDLPSALKSYAQARDYCTTDKHIIEMCLNVLRVAVHMRNYTHVANYLNKLDQISTAQNESILKSKIAGTFGLVALHERRFHVAAIKFIQCSIDVGSHFNDVLAAEDIALYGGVCALASFTRVELRDKVINNASFKSFLELVPWLRELITDFYSSNYAACLRILEKMKSELRVDMYLAHHVDELVARIRDRAIIQYFSPYSAVDLSRMASAFQTTTAALEDEVAQLIRKGKIHARIDSHAKVLHAFEPNKRHETYRRAFEVGQKYAADSRNLLLRMSMVKNNVVVREE